MKLISFLIGFITGFCIIKVIVKKLCEKDKSFEIKSCEDCPVYVEKNGTGVTYHYDD